MSEGFNIGDKVIYIPDFGKPEKGIVKSWNDGVIFVVYNCNEDWDNFQDYTGAATRPEDLMQGWRDD